MDEETNQTLGFAWPSQDCSTETDLTKVQTSVFLVRTELFDFSRGLCAAAQEWSLQRGNSFLNGLVVPKMGPGSLEDPTRSSLGLFSSHLSQCESHGHYKTKDLVCWDIVQHFDSAAERFCIVNSW